LEKSKQQQKKDVDLKKLLQAKVFGCLPNRSIANTFFLDFFEKWNSLSTNL